jgi:hypothetical protein
MNNLRSKTLEQIQNLVRHRLRPDWNPGPLQSTLFKLGDTSLHAWIQKMDVMVMADDEDSDFVANDAEQEVIWEPLRDKRRQG